MRILITFLLLAIFFSFQACDNTESDQNTENRGYIVNIGDTPENISFNLIDGSTTSLEELKGKVVVLQFTASWCSVCRKEMPHLESDVWQRFKNEDFILIGVDFDEELDKVIEFQKKMKTTYPMSLDPDAEIFSKFAHKKSGVTRNVVLDKSGEIVFLTRLYDRKEFEKMIKVIEDLL